MSKQQNEQQNDHLVMISGASGTGKSASLMNLSNPEGVVYLNCESKKIPFRSKFQEFKILDPLEVVQAFDEVENMPEVHSVVIDTSTFLMDMYESLYVINSQNTMKAWGDYAQYFKNLMMSSVASSSKNVIFLAHTKQLLNEAEMVLETKIPVKGSLANQGIEAFFSTVVSTKKMSVAKLKDYSSNLLTITDEEKMLGYKHVYQTRITKDTINERIRSPMGMWDVSETFIDNNAELLMQRLREYYD